MITVNSVSVVYKMPSEKITSFKDYVVRLLKGKLKYEMFRALDNVSFEVERGETIGILGQNGAGKSTLLKVISGIIKPTEGSVAAFGGIVPMLELGSGFDLDLTGQENIFLNGALLGYSEAFLKSKYNDIVAYSELDEFINVPIRNYSSGMLMRLAFSIASVVEPEILIVDEILAVGDSRFQEKSRGRMKELMGGGTTVLFVSHNIEQIRELCTRVIWLDHGTVKMLGDTQSVCDAYEKR